MKLAGPRIGVLGAGQLALMLAEAADRLGLPLLCAGQAGDCAARVARVVPCDLADAGAVRDFAAQADILTFESENIDVAVLAGLNVFPPARAVAVAQDRLLEKRFLQECGFAVAPFAPVNDAAELARALSVTGLPAILKTRRLGYDGKGQARLVAPGEAETVWHSLGGVPCIVEAMVPFRTEVSLLAARGREGQVVFYPLTENFHREGILRMSVAPCEDAALQTQAELGMLRVLERLDYVGVLAVEFFVTAAGLVANEMAPRVHNSGHWTIEGARTSQFENHLRAIGGLKLGPVAARPTVMLNCIGTMPAAAATSAWPALHRHDYGKAARPGRKVGHLTVAAAETATIEAWRDRLS